MLRHTRGDHPKAMGDVHSCPFVLIDGCRLRCANGICDEKLRERVTSPRCMLRGGPPSSERRRGAIRIRRKMRVVEAVAEKVVHKGRGRRKNCPCLLDAMAGAGVKVRFLPCLGLEDAVRTAVR